LIEVNLITETIFWITLNAILLVIFVTLLVRFLRKIRGRRIVEDELAISSWSHKFDILLRGMDDGEAVKQTFRMVLEDLALLNGLNSIKSLTSRELVVKLSSRLPQSARASLIKLYRIYEPIRFGGAKPDEGKVREFREALEKLELLLHPRLVRDRW